MSEVVFRQQLEEFNKQLSLDALTFSDLNTLKGVKPDAVIWVGMGGSSIPGRILQNIANYVKIPVPIITWRDFGLPVTSFKNPLYLFVSFSGNTRETLSGWKLASKAKLRAVISSGGTLLKEAGIKKLPRAQFDTAGMQPRQGTGLMLYAALGILKTVFPAVSAPDLSTIIRPASFEKIGAELAKKIGMKTVAVYTSSALEHIGQVLRINMTETGKTLALSNTFPEINHNDLTAFETSPKDVIVLLALGADETTSLHKEATIVRMILKEDKVPELTVTIPGKNPLEVAMNGVVLAQWLGFFLAHQRKLDPGSLITVNKIKKLVGQK